MAQMLLSLDFFVDSTKETGTNYELLWHYSTKIQFLCQVLRLNNAGSSAELGAFLSLLKMTRQSGCLEAKYFEEKQKSGGSRLLHINV